MSEHEQVVTDEMLMAYADGELDAETQAAVGAAIERDRSLAATVAIFRATRQASLAAYADILAEAPSEKLRNAVAGLDAGRDRSPTPFGHRLSAALRRRDRRSVPSRQRRHADALSPWGMSLAACLVLAAGIGGYFMRDLGNAPPALNALLLETGSSLTAALSAQPSGGKSQLGAADGPAELTLTGTYEVEDGLCRAFTLRQEDVEKGSVRALACRRQASDWRVEMALREAGNDSFSPASDQAANAINDQLDALGAGAPLARDAETAALARLKTD